MAYPEFVTTARLRLTRWDVAAHTAALAAVNAEAAAVEFLNDGLPYTPEESRRQSERFSSHWELHGFGLWAVALPDRVIGFAGLTHPRWFPRYASEVEIGWRLHPRAWHHGYAGEAATAALTAAPELSVDRVIAIIDPGNHRSVAVARRLGMTRVETAPHPQRAGLIDVFAIAVRADPRA